MFRPGIIIVCVSLVVAGAALHGRATQRWDSLVPTTSKIESLHDLTIPFSDYVAVEIPSDMEIKEKSRCTCRQYSSAQQNQSIIVSLTTGIPGSVSTHTPDVCYVSSGYRMTRSPTKQTIELPGGKIATYYVAEFEKKRAAGIDRQRIRWAWTTDGTWDAPNSPRFQYLRANELAKVYLVTKLPEETSANRSSDDPPAVRSFMVQVLSHYSASLAK